MADDDVYTIEADIPEIQTIDAYLNSYRAYTGPHDGLNGIPLGSLPHRAYPLAEKETNLSAKTSDQSDNSFIQYRPSGHMKISALAAFFCFCPVGMAALVYSCRARCAKRNGEFSKAAILGKSARDLAVASIVLGIAMLLIIVLVVVLICFPDLGKAS